MGVNAESGKIRSSLYCATVIEMGKFGNRVSSICFFSCILIYISLHSINNLRRFTTMLLDLCAQQKLKQRI